VLEELVILDGDDGVDERGRDRLEGDDLAPLPGEMRA
jgi:hypothetical protein